MKRKTKPKKKVLTARAQRLIVRNDRIRKDFDKDKDERKLQRILNDLGDKYTLDPDTIYLIVCRSGRYKL